MLLLMTIALLGAEPNVTHAEAESAMKRFVAVWSTCEPTKVRDIIAYPHTVHHGNRSAVTVYKDRSEFDIDGRASYYATLKGRGYDHSEVVATKLLYATPLEATVLVEWRRVTAEGKELLRAESIYIISRETPNDELRVQIRHFPRRKVRSQQRDATSS